MTTGKRPEITYDVLPQRARDHLRKISADAKLGADFLKRAGIMDQNGQLAAPYKGKK